MNIALMTDVSDKLKSAGFDVHKYNGNNGFTIVKELPPINMFFVKIPRVPSLVGYLYISNENNWELNNYMKQDDLNGFTSDMKAKYDINVTIKNIDKKVEEIYDKLKSKG